jgi:hypothetical protein
MRIEMGINPYCSFCTKKAELEILFYDWFIGLQIASFCNKHRVDFNKLTLREQRKVMKFQQKL